MIRLSGIQTTMTAGLLATYMAAASGEQTKEWATKAMPTVKLNAYSGTNGSITIVPTSTLSLVDFFGDLQASQTRLPAEFEKVLFDNLWNLYAR